MVSNGFSTGELVPEVDRLVYDRVTFEGGRTGPTKISVARIAAQP